MSTLFFKECKKTICSLTFIIYVAAVLAMYVTQFESDALDAPAEAPRPGSDSYGSIPLETPEILMPAAVESLISEYLAGSYTTYPLLTYKEVKLKESETAQIADIIMELTDITREELDSFTEYEPGGYMGEADEEGNTMIVYRDPVLPEYDLSDDISYERFKELMTQADKIIGRGSKYGEKFLVNNFSRRPLTYEGALADYEQLMDEKNIAEGYMRLYCDYMGIILGIVPVFVCVGLWQMDKRSRMEQLIYSRKISSARLLITRYLALVCCMAAPVVLTALHAMIGMQQLYPEKNIYFAKAVVLAIVWLLPSIMIVTGAGALIAELFSPFLSIFLQGAWWMFALTSEEALTGDIPIYALIVRHNNLGKAMFFEDQYENFVWNRTGYFVLSVIVVGLTVLLYEKVRKGKRS